MPIADKAGAVAAMCLEVSAKLCYKNHLVFVQLKLSFQDKIRNLFLPTVF
jgi:hypothetical protein